MEFSTCAYCGCDIESKGIQFKGQSFCSDECCEEFDSELAARGVPKLDELENVEVDDPEFDDDGLRFRNDDNAAEKDFDDEDDFAIEPDDF